MKENVKRHISFMLVFALLLGMFTHLSIRMDTITEPTVMPTATPKPTATQTRRWACRDYAPAFWLSLVQHKKQEQLPLA